MVVSVQAHASGGRWPLGRLAAPTARQYGVWSTSDRWSPVVDELHPLVAGNCGLTLKPVVSCVFGSHQFSWLHAVSRVHVPSMCPCPQARPRRTVGLLVMRAASPSRAASGAALAARSVGLSRGPVSSTTNIPPRLCTRLHAVTRHRMPEESKNSRREVSTATHGLPAPSAAGLRTWASSSQVSRVSSPCARTISQPPLSPFSHSK